ncbi:YrzI family small protein [Cytobacillus gottheilii]|nr:YrzI family small protein [Cytobacillus gottheilii]
MTLNILFFTVTIHKRKLTTEDALREEMCHKLMEENRDRQFSLYGRF